MNSERDLSLLVPQFREKVETMLTLVESEYGFKLVPYFTLRDVKTQAKLWRQSRTTSQIKFSISKLISEGAPFLAKVLDSVGPQHGRWATNALPGQSWHQLGEAVDCFVLTDKGGAAWSAEHPGYAAYAKIAKRLGLNHGLYWKRKDAVHVQYRDESVRTLYTWPQLDKMMEKKYGK